MRKGKKHSDDVSTYMKSLNKVYLYKNTNAPDSYCYSCR